MKIDLFGGKPQIQFNELDVSYQNHFIKEYAITGAITIGAIILCITIKQWLGIPICLIACAVYSLYLYSIIRKSLSGSVLIIDAKVIDVDGVDASLLGSKLLSVKTRTIVLQDDNGCKYKQDVPTASTYKVGDTVRMYTDNSSISQINQNMFTVINPIYMHILAN